MMSPHGSNASTIAAAAWYLFIVAGIVILAIAVAVAVIWWRAHRRVEVTDPDPVEVARVENEESDGSARRAVRWLGAYIPLAILVVTFGVGVTTVVATRNSGTPPVTIDVVGRQWFWDVTYPDAKIRTANEIHVPVGQKVRLRVTSADVIHSFWVPKIDRKIDLVPGRTNVLYFKATDVGVYRGECAEFCGIEHAKMRFLLVAESQQDFDTWMAGQATEGHQPSTPDEARGQQVLLGSACAYCHTIAGTNASGTVGPDLTHLASRQEIAAGTLSNTAGNLGGWLLDPQHVKPGNHMPGSDLSGEELTQIIAYLESLK